MNDARHQQDSKGSPREFTEVLYSNSSGISMSTKAALQKSSGLWRFAYQNQQKYVKHPLEKH